MQTEPNAKQQIVERIKSSTNILVTVGNNPSVDELSAALALSLMLNRLDKHVTAVFSGATPPAITFLQPEKTFENTVDSLRDFIIALDKEKADRLRYKVEDDVVRIFITPYKTVISEKDLQFSQGDFNVELIIALGVEKREDLDAAITAHGRILHDATVVTINDDGQKSSLGSIDWTDSGASSLCEMLMSLSEALQSGLLDEQIATALLTGIVSATDRFRNEHTSPRVMTMSAQLMAAGANQQLIATKLEEGVEKASQPAEDGLTPLVQGESAKVSSEETTEPDGALEIAHTEPATEASKSAEDELAENLAQATVGPVEASLSAEELQKDIDKANQEVSEAAQDSSMIKKGRKTWRSSGDGSTATPTFGGTLNATTSEAEEEKRREEELSSNHQILSHDAAPASVEPPVAPELPGIDAMDEPFPVAPAPEPMSMPELPVDDTAAATADPFQSRTDGDLSYEPVPISGSDAPTLADIDSQTRGKAAEDARAAVDAVLNSMPFDPSGQPAESSGAMPAVEVSHDADVEVTPVVPAVEQTATPEPMQPVAPLLPPLPDFSTLPPLPDEQPAPQVPPMSDPGMVTPVIPSIPVEPAPSDPAQFKIPGQ